MNLKEWLEHFKSGNCHTDYAADERKGQENIIEFLEDYLNKQKLITRFRYTKITKDEVET